MSQKEEPQHSIHTIRKEDVSTPSKITLPEPEKPSGLILSDGSINWDCPCLGGMVAGPCGVPFREAFSCFHYSETEPKGSDCMDAFSKMQDCMKKYAKLYGPNDEGDIFNVDEQSEEAEIPKLQDSTTVANPEPTVDHKSEQLDSGISNQDSKEKN